eukprot:5078794-Lingulodinium_polyedra.AAC.1
MHSNARCGVPATRNATRAFTPRARRFMACTSRCAALARRNACRDAFSRGARLRRARAVPWRARGVCAGHIAQR